MKIAILALLVTGARPLSLRRLQGAMPAAECNEASDCYSSDVKEAICVPKSTGANSNLRRKLFGGVVYTGYCLEEVCMASQPQFLQAHAEGMFASDSNPFLAIQAKGWCTDGTFDSFIAHASRVRWRFEGHGALIRYSGAES